MPPYSCFSSIWVLLLFDLWIGPAFPADLCPISLRAAFLSDCDHLIAFLFNLLNGVTHLSCLLVFLLNSFACLTCVYALVLPSFYGLWFHGLPFAQSVALLSCPVVAPRSAPMNSPHPALLFPCPQFLSDPPKILQLHLFL